MMGLSHNESNGLNLKKNLLWKLQTNETAIMLLRKCVSLKSLQLYVCVTHYFAQHFQLTLPIKQQKKVSNTMPERPNSTKMKKENLYVKETNDTRKKTEVNKEGTTNMTTKHERGNTNENVHTWGSGFPQKDGYQKQGEQRTLHREEESR